MSRHMPEPKTFCRKNNGVSMEASMRRKASQILRELVAEIIFSHMYQMILTSKNKWSHTVDYKETPKRKGKADQILTITHET
jgi:hypothetical protein